MTDEAIAAHWIRSRAPEIAPRIGIILGSGLGAVADAIDPEFAFEYRDIPGFPHSSVAGHAGRLVLGHLNSVPIVAMLGRAHLYEGWSVEQATLPVRAMALLGIELLIVTNASGGIQRRFRSGEPVLIDQHIDLMFRIQERGDRAAERDRARVPFAAQRHSGIYDPIWLDRAEKVAIELGFSLPRATYLATLGPNFETRAEYRAFARMGADLVGMSTVPEILAAAESGLPTLALSVVTNVANPDAPAKTGHDEVLAWTRAAQGRVVPLLERLLQRFF